MAILAEMDAITNRKILDYCPDTYHNDFVCLRETFRTMTVLQQSGKAVQIPFKYRETNQGGYYDGSHTQLTVAKYSTIVGGYLGWSHLYVDEYIGGDEMAENSGPEAFVDLMEQRGKDIVDRAMRLHCTNAYSGTMSSNEIMGFAGWLLSSGSVAEIDVGVYTTFASNLKTQTGGVSAMTKDDLNDLLVDIFTDSGNPRLAFCDWNIWQRLQALTEAQVRYEPGEGRKINAQWFDLNNVRFYFDSHATANKIYFIDPTTWRWIVKGPKKTYGITVGKWHDRNDYVDTKQKVVKWCGQLVCIDARRNGVYTITA